MSAPPPAVLMIHTTSAITAATETTMQTISTVPMRWPLLLRLPGEW